MKQKYHFCGCGAKEGEYHKENCEIVENKGHNEMFFLKPNICARCGKKEPKQVMLPDDIWKIVIGNIYHYEDILCPECLNLIVDMKREYLRKLQVSLAALKD